MVESKIGGREQELRSTSDTAPMIFSGVKLGPIPGRYNVKVARALAMTAVPTQDPQIYGNINHLLAVKRLAQ